MRSRTLLPLGALAVAACLVAARSGEPVDAGTAVRMDLPELAARAELIVEGRVLSAQAHETADGLIETEYALAVARTFHGADQPERRLRLPGGALPDGRGMLLPGMPRIAVGEDVLLFLSEPAPSGRCMPVGLAQGKFGLRTDADGRRALVREAGTMSLADPASGGLRHGQSGTRLDYAAVVAELHAALERRARGVDGRAR